MKKKILSFILLAAFVGLTGCDQKEQQPTTATNVEEVESITSKEESETKETKVEETKTSETIDTSARSIVATAKDYVDMYGATVTINAFYQRTTTFSGETYINYLLLGADGKVYDFKKEKVYRTDKTYEIIDYLLFINGGSETFHILNNGKYVVKIEDGYIQKYELQE